MSSGATAIVIASVILIVLATFFRHDAARLRTSRGFRESLALLAFPCVAVILDQAAPAAFRPWVRGISFFGFLIIGATYVVTYQLFGGRRIVRPLTISLLVWLLFATSRC